MQRNTSKKVSGLYLYSQSRSLGKSSFVNAISKLELAFRHCLSDNGWQDRFDVDTISNDSYKVYLVDGINEADTFDFSVIENICDSDVSLKRRGTTPGILRKGTPFLITSNISPKKLFGNVGGRNLKARAMIVNLGNVVLFPLINEIIDRHELEPFVENNLNIPADISDSD